MPQYKKYKVRQGRTFKGVTQEAQAGEHVFFPADEDVSAFDDKIELVGDAKPAEIKDVNLKPQNVELPERTKEELSDEKGKTSKK